MSELNKEHLESSYFKLFLSLDLTEREYKALKKILAEKPVIIQPYDAVSKYVKSFDVGKLCQQECMSSISDLKDTLQFILKTTFWYEKMSSSALISLILFFKPSMIFPQVCMVAFHRRKKHYL